MKAQHKESTRESQNSERVATVIADRILKTQRRWADRMNSQFAGLSPLKSKLLLLAAGLAFGSWSVLLIFSKAPQPIAVAPQPLQLRQVTPSDSLILMEYIYKTNKK
jgi:hypothetical protein